MKTLSLLSLTLALIACAPPAPTSAPKKMDEQATKFTNPVWNHDFPDPFITFDNGTFYAYATHKDNTGFQLLTSNDLVHWKQEQAVFKPTWADTQYWAPEVHHFNQKWYFVYSAQDRTTKKRDVAIAVGPSPKGPFKDLGKLIRGVTKNPNKNPEGAIDATLYFEGNTPYLLYTQEEPRSIDIVELSPDLSKTVGEVTTLIHPDRPLEKGVTEAPTLVKHDGQYWLFYSSGWFQSYKRDACYQVWAAHSSSLNGPYPKPEKPLLTTVQDHVYSPGHQSIFQLPSGEWWITYHAWDASAEPLYSDNHTGRTLRIDRLTWTPGGPTVNGPTYTQQPAPHSKLR